jgi:Na+-driven multidrug efflux pump
MFYALSAIIGPFVGQNTSAGKTDRILRALRLCMIFSVFTGLMIALMLFLMSNFLVTLFSNNPVIIGVAIQFLLIVPISYGAHGVVMIMTASFNGMGKPIPAVVISVGRMMAMYVPMAFLLGYFYGIAGIFIAYGLANVLSGIVAYFWARFSVKGQIEKMS